MQELLFGVLVGLAASGIHLIAHQFLYFEVLKLRLVPWRSSRKKAFLNRVRRVLHPKMSRSVAAVLFAPAIPLAVVCWWFFGVHFAQGTFWGYLLISGISLFAMMNQNKKFQVKMQKLALDRLMRYSLNTGSQDDQVVTIIEKAAEKALLPVKVYALQQLARLGNPQGRLVLEKFKDSPDDSISLPAGEALKNLDKLLSGEEILSAKQLPVFIDEAEYWHRQYYSPSGPTRRESEERQAELVAIINDIVDSQLLIRKAFPDLLCTRCHTRAEEHVQGRWTYILCRHCGDVMHLKAGIKTVVGCIGNFPPEREEGGVLYLNLWQGKKRKGIYADVDQLVIEGGGDMNYDWAVSAVVAQLQEHWPEEDTEFETDGIEVVLRNDPPLDTNSKNLLREIGWKG